MRISSSSKICLVIGDPVEHSLSPAMHNAAYEKLGLDDRFVFAAARVRPQDTAQAAQAVKTLGIHGLTCTAPHKVEIMAHLDWVDPIARLIGSANTVVNQNGRLIGYNTDWLGIITPIKKIISPKNKQVALLGAGGAARAAAYALLKEGSQLTVFNRTLKNAQELVRSFQQIPEFKQSHCKAASLAKIEQVKKCDIIINTTTIGMEPDSDKSLVPKECLHSGQVVLDAVYTPPLTQLLKDARSRGARIIPGLEMLLYQGTAQFKHYTGRPAPEKVMRQVLEKHLKTS